MKNILIPTDFSENSWNAITYALSFFKKVSCNFYLLNVSQVADFFDGTSAYTSSTKVAEKTLLKEPKVQLQQLIERIELLPKNSNHTFISNIANDFFVEAIRKHIKENDIDMIVMGTKGASGIQGAIVGSHTGDVITKVKCPVLVIPEKATYTDPKEIAFPTDYNIYYKSRILRTVSEILEMNQSVLRVLHISKKQNELTTLQEKNKGFLDNYLEDIDHSFHFLTCQNIEEAIQRFVESRNINMIAMIAKNLNFFQRILFHPTIKEISYHTEIPFLVLHE